MPLFCACPNWVVSLNKFSTPLRRAHNKLGKRASHGEGTSGNNYAYESMVVIKVNKTREREYSVVGCNTTDGFH